VSPSTASFAVGSAKATAARAAKADIAARNAAAAKLADPSALGPRTTVADGSQGRPGPRPAIGELRSAPIRVRQDQPQRRRREGREGSQRSGQRHAEH
jgi:hypothetical protein